jgi:hypothetical protein
MGMAPNTLHMISRHRLRDRPAIFRGPVHADRETDAVFVWKAQATTTWPRCASRSMGAGVFSHAEMRHGGAMTG